MKGRGEIEGALHGVELSYLFDETAFDAGPRSAEGTKAFHLFSGLVANFTRTG